MDRGILKRIKHISIRHQGTKTANLLWHGIYYWHIARFRGWFLTSPKNKNKLFLGTKKNHLISEKSEKSFKSEKLEKKHPFSEN